MCFYDNSSAWYYILGAWHCATISSFAALLQLAFASNVAYAALFRAGKYQGTKLLDYAGRIHKSAHDALQLLKSEGDAYEHLSLEDAEIRAQNIVSQCRSEIHDTVKIFAASSLVVSVLIVVALYLCAMFPNFQVGSIISALVLGLAFLPVPWGLAVAYHRVSRCEGDINDVYRGFHEATTYVAGQPKEAGKAALERLRLHLLKKRDGVLKRVFQGVFGGDN